MWHRLKGSTGSSRTRSEECNRDIARRGERIWAAYQLVGKGREAALVNYVWECTRGEERRDCIIACLRSNVNSDQWNGSRSSSIGGGARYRIHSRLIFQTAERESRLLAIENCRSMENASRGSRLMTLSIIIYVRSISHLRARWSTDSWTLRAKLFFCVKSVDKFSQLRFEFLSA